MYLEYDLDALEDEVIINFLLSDLHFEEGSLSQTWQTLIFNRYRHLLKPQNQDKKVHCQVLDDLRGTFYLSCSIIEHKDPERIWLGPGKVLFNYSLEKSLEKSTSWPILFSQIKSALTPFQELKENQKIKLSLALLFESKHYNPYGGRIDLNAMLQSSQQPGIYAYYLDSIERELISLTLVMHDGEQMYLFPDSCYLEDDVNYLSCSRLQFQAWINDASHSLLELKDLDFPWHELGIQFDPFEKIKI